MKQLPISHRMPLSVGVIHFVGIGGIGMSGIAEILHNLGYKVQGSDVAVSYNTERLARYGIDIFIGHSAEHVEGAAVVVVSSAIRADNPEFVAARNSRIPVVKRAEMLAEIMRLKMSVAIAGTHGKTTTTALTAALLEGADMNPTVINGGIINARGTNAYLGEGEWMVVEADESDGSFTRLPATIAVVTNIDPEHLDHYGSFEAAKAAYLSFLNNIPFYGFAVLCTDHPEVRNLAAKVQDRRFITYGTNPQADVRAVNIRSTSGGEMFDVEITSRDNDDVRTIKNILLPMYGNYNVSNSLAAIAIATELKISDEDIVSSLGRFEGVKRRFTKAGVAGGITIIDDYGHHPVEIASTLKAARSAQEHNGGKVIAVVQPHRYSRVRDLFADFCGCFNDADTVIVTDIYPAGEEPIEGVSSTSLTEGIIAAGHRHALCLDSPDNLANMVRDVAESGDMVVCLGAGSISKWAYQLVEQLEDGENRKLAV
ncbi:MAG: UDP-N-acetylmuramate--L-alanine ligase [Rickettsiales bacterium]